MSALDSVNGAVIAHPTATVMLMVGLMCVVVYLMINYRGIFGIGPYSDDFDDGIKDAVDKINAFAKSQTAAV